MSEHETSTSEPVLEGGCLCGVVRYRVSGMPFMTEYCHCSMCRRVSGGPAACWMDFKAEQLTWTQGAPAEYASSQHTRRGFCAACGSTLSFRDERYPQYACLAITSLDEPERVPPVRHIYVDDQLDWLKIADGHPRFRQGGQSEQVDP